MISNIYILATYNRYINALKEHARRLPLSQVTGSMVLLKNENPPGTKIAFSFGLVADGQEKFIIPETTFELDQNLQQNCSLVSKFMVSPHEFKALRGDVESYAAK